MRLTHFGHACITVEDPAMATGRLMIDPGNLADEIDGVDDVESVLVTHEHPDHLDAAKLAQLRAKNPELELLVNPGTVDTLPPGERDRAGVLDSTVRNSVTVSGMDVEVVTTTHATIYPGMPVISNNAYLVGGRIWHPGDSFEMPEGDVDVLLLPIGAPWLKLSEVVDYFRAVAPRLAIPIHQGGLAPAHRKLHCDLLRHFGPEDSELIVLDSSTPLEV